MTFKLAINPFFWAAVAVSLVGDMGVRIEGGFKAKYRRLKQKEYEALLKRMNLPVKPVDAESLALAEEAAKAEGRTAEWRITDRELLDLVLLDWDDLLDENDAKLPYTPENLERAEEVMGVRAAMVQAFFDAHNKAPEKNSGARRGASTN